ncbi:MAG: transposase [Blastocatellia bacterium]|nr:transposase [Blastocatellia bacterium]
MSGKPKRKYSPSEKVAILRKHLIEKVAISKVCEENRLQPKLFYKWQQEFFERGEMVFGIRGNGVGQNKEGKEKDEKIKLLEEKLVRKNEVVAELMEELIKAKKGTGVL